MGIVKGGARIGAAAFVVGLSVAGPQAAGVASADSDGQAVSARTADQPTVERTSSARSRGAGSATRRGAAIAPPAAAAAESNTAETTNAARPVGAVRAEPSVGVRVPSVLVPAAAAAEPVSGSSSAVSISRAARITKATNALVGTPPVARVVPSTPTDLVTSLNTAVANWFDSSASWLSALPANPLFDFLQGALLLTRRSLFNQAPEGVAVQWMRASTGDVVGGIDTTDAEGDAVTYEVQAAPSHGTVTIDANGIYTYTPGADYAGSDSFTVAVDNPSGRLNVLDLTGGPTIVPVSVTTTAGVPFVPGPVTQTSGFDVYNLTSRYLVYQGDSQCEDTPKQNCGDLQGDGPKIGRLLAPGESMHFEVVYYVFLNSYAYPQFQTVTGSDPGNLGTTTYRTQLHVMPFSDGARSIETCKIDGAGDCSHNTSSQVYLKDPKGTVATIPASSGALQGQLLDALCTTGGKADCSFGPPDGRQLFDLQKDFNYQAYSDTKEIATFYNGSSNPVEKTFTYSSSITEGSSLEVSAEMGFDLLGIVSASLSAAVGRTWESSSSKEESTSYTISPGSTVHVVASDPVKRVTGDFTATIGNTTVTLKNISFDVLDGTRAVKFSLLEESGPSAS